MADSKTRRIALLLLLFAVLLIPFLLPISHELKRNVLVGHLGSRLHILLFILVTLLLYHCGPTAGRLLRTALGAALAGIVIEVVQEFVGRHCRVQDFGLDVLGIGLACCWLYWRASRTRRGPLAAIVLAAVILTLSHEVPGRFMGQRIVAERFPLLADFETKWEWHIWGEKNIKRLEVVSDDVVHGRCLRVECKPGENFPGAEMSKFPPDWSDYATLAGEVRAEVSADDSLRVAVTVQDYRGFKSADRTMQAIMTGRQWTSFSLPLHSLRTRETGRPLDLHDVYSMVFYLDAVSDTTVFRIDNIRLEH